MTLTAFLALAPVLLIALAIAADKALRLDGGSPRQRRTVLIGAGTLLAVDHLIVFTLLLNAEAAPLALLASAITATAGLIIAAEAWRGPQPVKEEI